MLFIILLVNLVTYLLGMYLEMFSLMISSQQLLEIS